MSLSKKGGIACAVVILAAGSSIFYVKQRGEDYIDQAIADLDRAGVAVVEQERNDGLLDFQRKYTANITDPVKLLNSLPTTTQRVLAPQYREMVADNSFNVDMTYVPWTMAGHVEVLFDSPSEKLVEELAHYPAGPFITKFLQQNGLAFYSDIENGKPAQLGIRDIDYSSQEEDIQISIGLHGGVATMEGEDKLVTHMEDFSFTADQGTEQFSWSVQGLDHEMGLAQSEFDFHTLFALQKSDLTIKVQGDGGVAGNFYMGISGIDADTKVETQGETLYATEKSSVQNLSFRFEEGGVESEVIVEGVQVESEVADLNKIATEKFLTILQSYKQGDEASLERALVGLLQGGGRFTLKDFSVAKTATKAQKMGIELQTGAARLSSDVTVAPNSFDPQLAPPLALADKVTASFDFEMLSKDYEAIKALTGLGMMIDGFVVKDGSQVKVKAQFDGKNVLVNGQPMM